MTYRRPERASTPSEIRTLREPRFPDLPLVMLIGSETTGGGELITAALQDNIPDRKRLVTMGQRTVGRAFIQRADTDAGFGNLLYKLSHGISYRPNGRPRQRTETSQPTDDWGVRPDPGFEVPVSADLMAELRLQAEMQAVRPAESDEGLPFDDITKDPFRLSALAYLRKQLK
jgi:C-terminal processing protease CtpA/Prc